MLLSRNYAEWSEKYSKTNVTELVEAQKLTEKCYFEMQVNGFILARADPVAQMVKNLPAMQETCV